MGTMRNLQRILKWSSVKSYVFVFLSLLAALSSFLEVLPSEVIGRFSNQLVAIPKTGAASVVLKWCLFYFLIVAIGAIVRNFFCVMTSRVANNLIRDIRNLAFEKLITVDSSRLPNSDSGFFVNMINGNCGRLEMVFSVALFTLVSDVFDLFWISVFICTIDWKLLMTMVAFVPVLYLLGKKSSKMQRQLAVQQIDTEAEMISKINETYANRPVVRVFQGVQREKAEFGRMSGAYREKSNRADEVLGLFYAVEKTVRYIAISLVIFLTASEIINGKYPMGSLISIVLYSQRFYAPITNIIRYIQMLQKGMASVDALQEFLDFDDLDVDGNMTFAEDAAFASLDQVNVTAKGKIILPEMSIRLEDRTLHLITGASGCGKSTLIKALLGEVKLTGGKIIVSTGLSGGNLFSYASQDTEIFSGTILENVLYPRCAEETPVPVVDAAKALLLKLNFPQEQWEKKLGEAGSTLSGGEKKRIAFARALLRPSRILILDEITTNLDGNNEALIAHMVADESKKRCVIMVTHQEHPAFAGVRVQRTSIQGKRCTE